jgi:hypothetical protein
MKIIALLVGMLTTANAFFSMHYVAKDNQPTVCGMTDRAFQEPPSAHQVADIFARVSGRPPLLHEADERMPVADIFAQNIQAPILLEVRGGSKSF